ncbi:hypothetical protein F8O01_13185 [Pseudoclavibacter chungangensis]|uniref:Uncharacterized protein n=1 Tax=Pseudoclavibacter chungangensis TaxID=587635 RepID=A0A7J5BPF0_9MICO|nr:DUF6177 family protein [Pseudoclavibacter chungangensis]KAB1654844.1 hypothetical protein F8O01_13185 [Pseudoclavibacter chungangensis]NYJ68033.1 hypothetical protein [Pseudoclavibacter chungangensis]
MTEPRTTYPHPLLDARDPRKGILVTRSVAPSVHLSAGRADFLVTAERADRRVVLVTGAETVLSDHLVSLMRHTSASWGVIDAHGDARDGFTGLPLRIPEQAPLVDMLPSTTRPHPDHLRIDPEQSLRVTVIVSRRHRASAETLLGGDAERLGTRIAGAPPAGWGLHEPAGLPWDRELLTTFARNAGGGRVIITSPFEARRSTGSITARRTRHGVEEITQLTVELGLERAPYAYTRLREAIKALESLDTGVPLFAAAFADHGRADLMRDARAHVPGWPAGILIGAPATRALGIDARAVAKAYQGTVLGGRRTPSLLLDVSDTRGADAWTRLRGLIDDLGHDRISNANPELARRLFPEGNA